MVPKLLCSPTQLSTATAWLKQQGNRLKQQINSNPSVAYCAQLYHTSPAETKSPLLQSLLPAFATLRMQILTLPNQLPHFLRSSRPPPPTTHAASPAHTAAPAPPASALHVASRHNCTMPALLTSNYPHFPPHFLTGSHSGTSTPSMSVAWGV